MCQAAGEEQLLKKVKDCLSISNENLCSFLVRVLSNFRTSCKKFATTTSYYYCRFPVINEGEKGFYQARSE